MSWSYSTALATAKDQVRLLLGDTDTTDQQLQDEEIAFFVTQRGDVYMSAVLCAESLAAKYSRLTDVTSGDQQKEQRSQKAAAYLALAQRLRAEARSRGVTPYAGGLSIGDKQGREGNVDRVTPFFGRQTHTRLQTEYNGLPVTDQTQVEY